MLIHGGKAIWYEFMSSVNGFEMHSGFGSHLPGVASFTSEAKDMEAGPARRSYIGLGRPIIPFWLWPLESAMTDASR